jgi:hypothetical protein
MSDLTARLADLPCLRESQQENLRGLIAISRTFSSDAGIPPVPEGTIGPGTIVLESGHQPNFLPYSGVWKKAFLLDSLRRELAEAGRDAVAVFGFSDHILSTASYLSQNQVPAYKKQGKENIGFRIPEKDRWRCFHVLDRPAEAQFHREIDKIRRLYMENIGQMKAGDDAPAHRLDSILELLSGCYHHASSFADMNAFFFSAICRDVFGLQLHFFRYSDVFGHGLLMNESRNLLSRPEEYASSLKAAITKTGIAGLSAGDGEVPFWYHCECGGKVHLSGSSPVDIRGTCPVCKTDHHISFGPHLDSLVTWYPKMSPNAIARNILFPEGFGTGLFISGTGGGLRYGQVADAVSREMGFHRPLTLAWRSADLYLGTVHNRAILELMKTFRLKIPDILEGRINEKIKDCRGALEQRIKEIEGPAGDKKAIQKFRGKYLNSLVQAETVRNVFSENPSFLDLLVTFDPLQISERWQDALQKATVAPEGYSQSVQADVRYPCEGIQGIMSADIPRIVHAMRSIEVV